MLIKMQILTGQNANPHIIDIEFKVIPVPNHLLSQLILKGYFLLHEKF